jgi:hypothetical protein
MTALAGEGKKILVVAIYFHRLNSIYVVEPKSTNQLRRVEILSGL